MKPDHGFTLIEIIVVLAIMGITSTLTAIALKTVDGPEREAFDDLLASARMRAISLDSTLGVDVAPGIRLLVHPDGSASPARLMQQGVTWEVDPWTAEVRRVR